MTETSASLGKPLLVFAVTLVALNIALLVINQFIELPNGSAMSFVAIVAAAIPAGQTFYRGAGRLPSTGERLRFAALGMLLVVVLNGLTVAGVFAYYGAPLSIETLSSALEIPADKLKTILMIGLAIGCVLGALILYFGLNGGAKSAAKQEARAK